MVSEFVICIDNQSNPASLIVGKVYQKLPDETGEELNLIRVVDEDTSEPDGCISIRPRCLCRSSCP